MALTSAATAPVVWKYLNGLFVVYKPAGITLKAVRSTVLHNLCRDMNNLEPRPLSKRVEIVKPNYNISVVPDYSDTIEATGPRYQMSDIRCIPSVNLGKLTSGVLLMGIDRDGISKAYKIRNNTSPRVFHISGRLGASTENNCINSRIVERADFGHVYTEKLTALISSLQGSHQRKAFELSGIDLQSQAAYELAVRGPITPPKDVPVIYSMKCIQFRKPYFTLEIIAANEKEDYLMRLIYEIGLTLRTLAHCTKLSCVKHGAFTVEDALSRENWNLQSIVANIASCNKTLDQHPEMLKIKQ